MPDLGEMTATAKCAAARAWRAATRKDRAGAVAVSAAVHVLLLAIFAAIAIETAAEDDADGTTEVAFETAKEVFDGPLDTSLEAFEPAAAVSGGAELPVVFEPEVELAAFTELGPELALPAVDDGISLRPDLGPEKSAGVGKFFGLESRGDAFVYVVDSSQSMRGRRFERACAELRRSIEELNRRQRFYVFFFSDRAYPMFAGRSRGPIPATRRNKRQLYAWMQTVGLVGHTDPLGAVLGGLRFEPDALFLLTDGRFERSAAERIAFNNRRPVTPILTIGFEDRGGEVLLKQIAEENGGTYRFVP